MNETGRQLVAIAQRMPEASDMLSYISGAMFDLWCAVTRLPIERDDFLERVFRQVVRGGLVMGVTLDDTAMVAIIEAASHNAFSPTELESLKRTVAATNKALFVAVRAAVIDGKA